MAKRAPMIENYEAVVIGSGQGGKPLATHLARAGWKTALIEREYVGGTCVNVGCTPTKTMVASARVAHLARRTTDYGVRSGPVSVDMKRVRERKRAIVEDFRRGSEASNCSETSFKPTNAWRRTCPAFTHISYDDFRILRTNLLDGGNATTKDRLVPYTIYIDPQLGRVGLTEQQART